jgi:hypothetical protein
MNRSRERQRVFAFSRGDHVCLRPVIGDFAAGTGLLGDFELVRLDFGQTLPPAMILGPATGTRRFSHSRATSIW